MFDSTTLKLNADPLILSALAEDISNEDISTHSVIKKSILGTVDLISKENGIICGLPIFQRVFQLLDDTIKFCFDVQDGDWVQAGQKLGSITGDIRVLLSGERTALNYLQHMSGIATYTNEFVSILRDSGITLLDSRKTTPNNRIFEKYAVKIGGAQNHRYNLSDGILLKDNHIGAAGSIKKAVQSSRSYIGHLKKIEVEVENIQMVKEALEAQADIIMLDNMNIDLIKEAISIIDKKAEIEISGNIRKENIHLYQNLDVQYISSGALTHSADILDLSLKNLHPIEEA